MKPIRVLIVDDSDFVREFITDLLSVDDSIHVIGEAVNGYEAISKVSELKPDIVTMDIDMPVMDGLESIEQIMLTCAVPILVVTSKSDADTAYNAISKGALEVIPKPDFDAGNNYDFIDKIKLLSGVKVIPRMRRKPLDTSLSNTLTITREKYSNDDKIIAIASSTGGPRALSVLLSALPENFPCPIVIAQHIADDFVNGMASWLDKTIKLPVKPGKTGDNLTPGTVYISPSEKHMKINHMKKITFEERSPQDIYFPSCNILLSSAAKVYKNNTIGIMLTGMGNDGIEGIKAIKQAGGTTIAQDESSSVIFGMPRVAIESGCIDKVLPVGKIANEIIFMIKNKLF